MSQSDNTQDSADAQISENADEAKSSGEVQDRGDDTIGAGKTEGADSFGPIDTETSEGERDSSFGGETDEIDSAQEATTDGNTSTADSGGDEDG